MCVPFGTGKPINHRCYTTLHMNSDNRDRSLRGRKVVSWIGVGLGVLAFFLPLVSIHAPIVGDLQWSSYNVVSEVLGSSNNSDSPSFSKMVSSQESQHAARAPSSDANANASSSRPNGDIPLGMRLAVFFPVAVLWCYVTLVGTVMPLLFSYSPKTVAFVNGLGLVGAAYSLISVFLLDDAVKTQMRQSMERTQSSPFAAFGTALVASIHIQPGAGLYFLLACFVCLLLVQYVAALDRLTLQAE